MGAALYQFDDVRMEVKTNWREFMHLKADLGADPQIISPCIDQAETQKCLGTKNGQPCTYSECDDPVCEECNREPLTAYRDFDNQPAPLDGDGENKSERDMGADENPMSTLSTFWWERF